jgi:threonine/homoserine/homoserine lactone efflux protein
VARPLGLLPAATFQLINPKAWIFAIGAITTFRPTEVPAAAGTVLVAVTMMIVIVPTATLWALAGGALGRLVSDERAHRFASLVLAGLVAATVASVWI